MKTKPVNACIRSYDFDLMQWDMLARRCAVTPESLVIEGEAVLRYRKMLVEEHLRRVGSKVIAATQGDYTVPVVECTCREIVDELLNQMCVGHPFAMSFYMQQENMVFSLRSDDKGINVAELAEEFNGGGHHHSAGFTVPVGIII